MQAHPKYISTKSMELHISVHFQHQVHVAMNDCNYWSQGDFCINYKLASCAHVAIIDVTTWLLYKLQVQN